MLSEVMKYIFSWLTFVYLNMKYRVSLEFIYFFIDTEKNTYFFDCCVKFDMYKMFVSSILFNFLIDLQYFKHKYFLNFPDIKRINYSKENCHLYCLLLIYSNK